VAEASFQVHTLSNLSWLSGGSYHLCGLYIHGVQYTKKDGNKVYGTYLPVLFENMAEPIITGREEVGFPKVYADIDVYEHVESTKVVLSWRGTQFATLEWNELGLSRANGHDDSSQPIQNPPTNNGLFVHRYIPAVGKKGEADADYTVFVPNDEHAPPPEQILSAQASKVSIESPGHKALPTLHNIVDALYNLPVSQIVESQIVSGNGIDNLSNAMRLE